MGSSPESVSESDGVFPTTFANTWETSYQPSPKSGGKVYLAGALTGARATGLRGFDMQKGYQQRLSSSIEDIDDASFRPTISTWGDSRLYLAGMSWLVLPRNNEYGLQSGRFDATDTNTTIKITFDPPYQKTPSVIAWIAGYHLGYQNNWRLKAEVKDVTSTDCTLVVDRWADTHVHTASACWIAHTADHPRVVSGSYSTDSIRSSSKPTTETYGVAKFSRSFPRPPHVIAALTSFDMDFHQNLRLKMSQLQVTSSEFHWSLDTWDTSVLNSATASYIAFAQGPSASAAPTPALSQPAASAPVPSSAAVKQPPAQPATKQPIPPQPAAPTPALSQPAASTPVPSSAAVKQPPVQPATQRPVPPQPAPTKSAPSQLTTAKPAASQPGPQKPVTTQPTQPTQPKPAASGSTSLGGVGLGVSAVLNHLGDTIVAIWDLLDTTERAPAKAEGLCYKNPGDESVVGDDERERVANQDILPGGKYRSIVKLFLRYETQRPGKYAMGTGWLIKPDLLVTAGHCVFDWGHGLGRLVEAKCYIGYDGEASINDPKAQVQFRRGVQIATSSEWLRAKGAKAYDVGFIKVETPFTGIIPIKYTDTPASGQAMIGVVGYPGDLADPTTREHGASMYEMFVNVSWDLNTAENNMLEYEIDTFGGNSGGPVLQQKDLASIGAHVYGGERNSASVIGKFGNLYPDYEAAFDMDLTSVNTPGATATAAVKYVRVPTKGMNATKQPDNSLDQRLFDIAMSKATLLSVSTTRQRKRSQLVNDQLYRYAAPLASIAIASADSYRAATQYGAEGFGTADLTNSGITEGAICSEAAFSAVLQMGTDRCERSGIFKGMREAIAKEYGAVQKIAPRLLSTITDPVLRICLKTVSKQGAESHYENAENGAEATFDQQGKDYMSKHFSTLIARIKYRTPKYKSGAESTADGIGAEGSAQVSDEYVTDWFPGMHCWVKVGSPHPKTDAATDEEAFLDKRGLFPKPRPFIYQSALDFALAGKWSGLDEDLKQTLTRTLPEIAAEADYPPERVQEAIDAGPESLMTMMKNVDFANSLMRAMRKRQQKSSGEEIGPLMKLLAKQRTRPQPQRSGTEELYGRSLRDPRNTSRYSQSALGSKGGRPYRREGAEAYGDEEGLVTEKMLRYPEYPLERDPRRSDFIRGQMQPWNYPPWNYPIGTYPPGRDPNGPWTRDIKPWEQPGALWQAQIWDLVKNKGARAEGSFGQEESWLGKVAQKTIKVISSKTVKDLAKRGAKGVGKAVVRGAADAAVTHVLNGSAEEATTAEAYDGEKTLEEADASDFAEALEEALALEIEETLEQAAVQPQAEASSGEESAFIKLYSIAARHLAKEILRRPKEEAFEAEEGGGLTETAMSVEEAIGMIAGPAITSVLRPVGGWVGKQVAAESAGKIPNGSISKSVGDVADAGLNEFLDRGKKKQLYEAIFMGGCFGMGKKPQFPVPVRGIPRGTAMLRKQDFVLEELLEAVSLVPEADIEEAAPLSSAAETLAGAADRAILGKAALAAVMQVPADDLGEEFWDTFIDTVTTITPMVLEAAPEVYTNVKPVVSRLLKASRYKPSAELINTGE